MTTLWYFNTDTISDADYGLLLKLLPEKIQTDIEAQINPGKKKLKLLAKLMIQSYFSNRTSFDWADVEYSSLGKPSLKNADQFNVSHADNYVIVAFAQTDIGVDIELKKEIEYSDIVNKFHSEELAYFNESESKLDGFYKIWSRKEAYLKATGIGLSNGMSNENSLEKIISHMDLDWHIRTLDLFEGYAAAICQNKPIGGIELKEFNVSLYLNEMV